MVSPFGDGALSAKLNVRLFESSIPSTNDLYLDMSDATELMVFSSSCRRSSDGGACLVGTSRNK